MPRRTQSTAVCLCRSMPTRKQSTARGVSLPLAQCPHASNPQPEGCLSLSLNAQTHAINSQRGVSPARSRSTSPCLEAGSGKGDMSVRPLRGRFGADSPFQWPRPGAAGAFSRPKKKKSFQRSLKRSLKRSRGRGWGDFGASATTSTLDRPQATQRRGSPSLSQLTHLFLPTLSRSLGLERLVVEDE